MRYVEIYETQDKRTYDDIVLLFKANGIDYKTLFEYRLLPENNFDIPDSGVKIKVLQRDYLTANHILISKGFKKDIYTAEFSFIDTVERYTLQIPLINRLPDLYRLILIMFVAVLCIIGCFILLFVILAYLYKMF